jgi:hypothetical protein
MDAALDCSAHKPAATNRPNWHNWCLENTTQKQYNSKQKLPKGQEIGALEEYSQQFFPLTPTPCFIFADAMHMLRCCCHAILP